MQFAKVQRQNGSGVVAIEGGQAFALDLARDPAVRTLADLLHAPDPIATARNLQDAKATAEPLDALTFLAPVDHQEVWAAGVTYKRSKVAREEESVGAAQFYDKVYTAPRPELFLKATPARVVDPGRPVRIRADAKWSVPEPELTLVISTAGKIVGFTVGNDMSSRDIEGENPLYLPQAKIYKGSCSIGPVVTPVASMPPLPDVVIKLNITRGGKVAFEGTTTLSQMARSVESLAEWLFKENEFPNGALLLTGTGIVPPDEFTLASGDDVSITIGGIGTLRNPVA
ncbi:fumarylacetoacetate hydrolase family protein [Frigoriglobus tundricola]|uniref:Fumarylacetoacetate hydrolase family protein n=1 Tax=Frigoriglobus tundricola TaxID=2774151 RepID=A0A6M5YYH5_9BACT|nr:fumarylacetoacetate hydrolase family protein [Frigoriglobus tundricola]QJW98908.1 Fumarylacetoacetate hydrolase family protein [Frigoriglobus tundricola]